MQYSVGQCNVGQCDIVQCSAVQCSAVHCTALHCRASSVVAYSDLPASVTAVLDIQERGEEPGLALCHSTSWEEHSQTVTSVQSTVYSILYTV